MVKNLHILKLLVSLLFFSAFAFGGVSEKKIALVNEFAFDSKAGIKKLHFAYNQMEMIDCFPGPCDQKTRGRWESMLVAPVLKEIEDSLKQVETDNNIIIFQIGKLDMESQLLALDRRFDITEQFTVFFNNKSQGSGKLLKLEIPNPKIGVINTKQFHDKQMGIRKLTESPGFDPNKACAVSAICVEIVKSIQDFAAERNFSLILDSSKGLPQRMSEFKTEEITADFILEYNKNNS